MCTCTEYGYFIFKLKIVMEKFRYLVRTLKCDLIVKIL